MPSFHRALGVVSLSGRRGIRCLTLQNVRRMSRSAEAYADALAIQPSKPAERPTFQNLGLHPPIVAALQAAFPNVKHPTEAQATFIPAILRGKDVLLKDETGSGKSFGLIVALLNKPRVTYRDSNSRTSSQKYITSLIIVPHRDLAYQLYYWIQQMTNSKTGTPPPSISSIAQVLVRDGHTHLTTGLSMLREVKPHILIGTPQAIWDVWKEAPETIQFERLSSVVVDEVDYLIETIPKKDPSKSFHNAFVKASKKLMAHPGVTRKLLDMIYSRRIEVNDRRRDEPGITQHRRRDTSADEYRYSPQLILSSATLRSHLNNYLFDESGWLNKDNLLKVKGGRKADAKPGVAALEASVDRTHDGLGGTDISHSILVVSNDGIENVAGAVKPLKRDESEDGQAITPDTIFAPSIPDTSDVDAELVKKYANTPSPFNMNALEAIATAFALDVPSVALLVLPSSAPLQRAVYELLEMGVNARGLDLLLAEQGRSHLLHGGGRIRENPTLLVSTLATTRGLDLPELTHVFILGIPEGPKVNGRTVDAYLHIAGRVGRFGRGGKVISVVEKEEAGTGAVTDAGKMVRILRTLDLEPIQFEHFD